MKESESVEKNAERKRQHAQSKKIRLKKPQIDLTVFKNFTKKQIICAIACLSIVVICICVMNYDKLGWVLNKNISDADVVNIELISSNNKIYPYGNELLVANSDEIAIYNKYGKQTWKYELPGAIDDYITTNGKYIQVINQDKSLVYIFKNKYEMARIKIEGEILSGYINQKGESVIEYTSAGNKALLAVYNNKGELQYNIKLSSNIIGKYVLSDNSKYLAYVDVNINGISLATDVKLIDLRNSSGQSAVQEMHSSDNSLVYDLEFNSNKYLVYKLDEQIVMQNIYNKEKKVSTIENESVVGIDMDKNKYAYVTFEDGKYFMGVRTVGGKDTKKIQLSEMPKYFVYNNGNIFVCYQKGVEIYNTLKMKIKRYDSDMVITSPTVFDNGRSLAFLISNKLIMFSI